MVEKRKLLLNFVGLADVVTTKMEQIMCASGYSDQFAGLMTSMFMTWGTLACIPITKILEKMPTPKRTINGDDKFVLQDPTLNYIKVSVTLGTASFVALMLLAQIPDQKVFKFDFFT